MTLTDTHAHLDYDDFDADRDEVLARAREAGVGRVIAIGTSVESSRRAIALAEADPGVYAVVGVHPSEAREAGEGFVGELARLASSPRVVAIGETGLDRYRFAGRRARADGSAAGAELAALEEEDARVLAAQEEVFRAQIRLARELGLNLVVHQREAWRETVRILDECASGVRAVFHCFGEGLERAREVRERGHLVSFTGIVTFRNAVSLREAVAAVPGGGYMVETDCPYLAPDPHRGKRCEPWHVRLVAERVATARGESLERVAEETEGAAGSFFAFRGRAPAGGEGGSEV